MNNILQLMQLHAQRRSTSSLRWWQTLAVMLMLLVVPHTVMADVVYFYNHTNIKKWPSPSQPWLVVELCYFDKRGNDSFFTSDPEIWIDGGKVATLSGLRVDTQTAADKERKNDGWYKDLQVGSTQYGKWWVRMYDPRRNGNKYYVDVYIVPEYINSGKHVLEVKGRWQADRRANTNKVYGWKPNGNGEFSFDDGGWKLSKVSRKDHKTVSAVMELSSGVTPTTVGVGGTAPVQKRFTTMDRMDDSRQFGNSGSVTSDFSYSNIAAKASDVHFEYAYKASFRHLKDSESSNGGIGSPTLFKWFSAKLSPYPSPGKLGVSTSLWDKSVTLSWNRPASGTDQGGRWAVLRSDGGSSAWEVVAENIASSQTSYTDKSQSLGFNKRYSYCVVFVPTGMSPTDMPQGLHSVAETTLTPKFDITIKEVTGGAESIVVKWVSQKFANAAGKKFAIYRAVEKGSGSYEWGSPIAEVNASATATEYTYTDKSSFSGCTNYVYKVTAKPYDGFEASSGETGLMAASISEHSKVVSLTATKGEYNSTVKLAWKVQTQGPDELRFEVARRVIGNDKWSVIHTTKGKAEEYVYEDNTALPGNYYDYRVRSIMNCGGSDSYTDVSDQGFCRSTGVISGRVSYGTGTAVPDAKVAVTKADGGDDKSQFYSMQMSGKNSYIRIDMSGDERREAFGDRFTIMMMVRPDSVQISNAYEVCLMSMCGEYKLMLFKNYDDLCPYMQRYGESSFTILPSFTLPKNQFSTVAFTRDGTKCAMYVITQDGRCKERVREVDFIPKWNYNYGLVFGADNFGGYSFNGCIDDIRVYGGVALSKEEILDTYNRPLTGSEKNLFLYWPMDEGIKNQTKAFDYSRNNGVANGRHGTIVAGEPSNELIPPASMFSLYARTDSLGNYTVRGVPFSGDGNTYNIVPELGVHTFTPIQQNAFVSASSIVHNGVNFTDNSSFKVTGRVFYHGTSIPVEGCNLYVDGNVCSKDGELIATKADGTFEISVPIGDHSIQVKKDSHVFTAGGRWPEDPNGAGVKYTFDREVSGITFWDSTLVNFTGRIAGGPDQYVVPLGFGKSVNNVGQATLSLLPRTQNGKLNVAPQDPNATTVTFQAATKPRTLASQDVNIASESWIAKGDSCNYIVIKTDPKTGEFSAMVPPLEYEVQGVRFVDSNLNNENLKEALAGFAKLTVNLTNPRIEYTDSIENSDGTYSYYKYVAALNRELRATPVFAVEQVSPKPKKGAFGIEEYTVSDQAGDDFTVRVYDVQPDGSIRYNYGAPLFETLGHYSFKLSAYELYTNYDRLYAAGVVPGASEMEQFIDKVPLSGLGVDVSNAMASTQQVYTEGSQAGSVKDLATDEMTLDSLGTYTYEWVAGLPNIVEPYKRSMQITSEIGNATVDWLNPGMDGIVLGALPSGTNFVTQGPNLVEMILRDPPGSLSKATWTKGKTTTNYKSHGSVWTSDNSVTMTKKLGVDLKIGSGIGVMFIQNTKAESNFSAGITASTTGESSSSWTRTVSYERAISTSDSPEFVGPLGDVFIGSSTNLIYGMAREVDLRRNTASPGTAKLGVEEVMTTGMSYTTDFQFTAYYIENTLMPNLEKLRNSLLVTVPSYEGYTNNTGRPVYITTLNPDDKGFGTNNNDPMWVGSVKTAPKSEGQSYKLVLPQGYNESVVDSIVLYNMSIDNWKKVLCANEKEKVMANKERSKYLTQNLSFDGGASVTMTETTTNSNTTNYDITVTGVVHLGVQMGLEVQGFGFDSTISTDTGGGTHDTSSETTDDVVSFSYTLAEDGADDAISVDVFKYGAYGPIFRTTGGQTSVPYEGEVRTSYYEEDEVLMVGTMQIERPQIMVDNKKWATVAGVPSGSAANYTLQLQNISDTNTDLYFKLLVGDGSNPDGAVVSIDGVPLTSGRLVKVPATETLSKKLQIMQSNQSVLRYDSIAIVLGSEMQWDPTSVYGQIADTVYVTAEFVPSSSPVEMRLNKTVLNAFTKEQLDITFRNFDRNYHGLESFRVQCYAPGSNGWSTLREYVVNPDANFKPDAVRMALPQGNDITYSYDMKPYTDGTYRFRVLSVSRYGQQEITRSSEETVIVKDMAKPRPLGLPEPSDGILGLGKEISITFNEDIVKGKLSATDNFEVTGVLNGATVDHGTALSMQNTTEAATTEADIDLGGKDFSIDFWYNAKSAGTLLSHGGGAEKFTVAVTDDNRLKVGVGKRSYTSDEELPMGKWAYLSLSYKTADNGGILNASVGYDAYVVKLFTDLPVVAYSASGRLSVGRNMSGAMHELTLWDEAHSMTKAQAERQSTKLTSTPHLIGYWPMNEGEGTVAADLARRRHLALPASTWFIDGSSFAVELDGSAPLLIPTGHIAPAMNDNYAVELWMKADVQKGEARLLQVGTAALTCNAAGQLTLTASDESLGSSSATVLDNAWHHVALNVLRSGNATVYIDGQRAITTAAANIGTLASDALIIGARRTGDNVSEAFAYDRILAGTVDEVRIWKATLDAATIESNRNLRLTGKESGLAAYYPFERQRLNASLKLETVPVDTCMSVVGTGLSATCKGVAPVFTDDSPALRKKPVEENVNFHFTASDNRIVFEITENPDRIEGCTLNFKVKEVYDANGNICDPVCWQTVVNRNPLAWRTESSTASEYAEARLEATKKLGTSAQLTAYIVNRGSTAQAWRIDGMPSWMQLSSANGTLEPQSEQKLTITVAPSCPAGRHNVNLYVTNADGMSTAMAVDVKVTGDAPQWNVDAAKYETSMNIIGVLAMDGTLSTDPDDIVGAFINGECRGVAHPTYSARYDNYFILMDVYADAAEKGQKVEFRAYDASADRTLPRIASNMNIVFESNSLCGSYQQPVMFTALPFIEQTINLVEGWNWTSLAVTPDDCHVQSIFADTAADIDIVKSKRASVMRFENSWEGKNFLMDNSEMYKVKALNAASQKLLGMQPDTDRRTITVRQGWNWIAYNSMQPMDIADAFAALSPVNGDLVKGKQGFAVFDGYEWNGTLAALMPGQGYMYRTAAADTRTFRYPEMTLRRYVHERNGLRRNADDSRLPEIFTPVDDALFAGNMTVVAQVTYDGAPLANVEVGVFAGDECRAHEYSDANGIVYLTIPGDRAEQLGFRVSYANEEYLTEATITYEDDGVVGNRRNPFVIAFTHDTPTALNAAEADNGSYGWTDLSGRRLAKAPQADGVYIRTKDGKSEKTVIRRHK